MPSPVEVRILVQLQSNTSWADTGACFFLTLPSNYSATLQMPQMLHKQTACAEAELLKEKKTWQRREKMTVWAVI